MTESAQSANSFVQKLSALAARFAAADIVVSSLYCDWGSFGSWAFQVQKGASADAYIEAIQKGSDVDGPEVLRFSWDGREHFLTVAAAPTPYLSAPVPWTGQLEKAFKDSAAAVEFAEEYVYRWVRGDA